MMQRKNKAKASSTSGYGSGYESNDNSSSNGNLLDRHITSSSPSKPTPSSSPKSGGISIASLTGECGVGNNNSDNNNNSNSNNNNTTNKNNNNKQQHKRKDSKIQIATVKRNNCGTQPFDKHWLNLDCCGLICASLTYCLHLYGVYSFGWILLPPWFSVMDEDGYRTLTFGCHFHRALFILIAALAVLAHFKAMTTDPGAVPPDANPLPEPEIENDDDKLNDLDNLIKGEPSPTKKNQPHLGAVDNIETMERGNANGNGSSLDTPSRVVSQSTTSSLMQEDVDLHDNHNVDSNNTNMNGIPQAVVNVGAVGAAVVGAAGVAIAGAASGVAAAAGPIKVKRSPMMPHQRGRRMCRRCQAFKPPRAHHCSICKRCIIKMDHHCPWVNNCVGIGNHKYFLLFIFYTSLSCAYSFLFIIYRFFNCIGSSKLHGPRCVDHPTDLLPLVGLTVEALLFGLFTLCMVVDQWDVVMTNLTHIDRLKGETHHGYGHYHQHSGAYGNLPQHYHQHVSGTASSLISNVRMGINEVFGVFGTGAGRGMTSPTTSRFHYTWLSPLHKACFPDHIRDDVFGYCRPCTAPVAKGARRISKSSMEMAGLLEKGKGKGRGGVSGAEIV